MNPVGVSLFVCVYVRVFVCGCACVCPLSVCAGIFDEDFIANPERDE
jgi:hypothetical protein